MAQSDVGQDTNDGELIHPEQKGNNSLEAIRSALSAGEESGEPCSFDAKAFNEHMLNDHV